MSLDLTKYNVPLNIEQQQEIKDYISDNIDFYFLKQIDELSGDSETYASIAKMERILELDLNKDVDLNDLQSFKNVCDDLEEIANKFELEKENNWETEDFKFLDFSESEFHNEVNKVKQIFEEVNNLKEQTFQQKLDNIPNLTDDLKQILIKIKDIPNFNSIEKLLNNDEKQILLNSLNDIYIRSDLYENFSFLATANARIQLQQELNKNLSISL